MDIIITNVNIITPYDIKHDESVLIKDGYIREFLNKEDIKDYKNIEIIDGKGQYLAPGFVDIHNHGNMNKDIMDASEEALDTIGEYHIRNGVTSYLGTVITSSYENIEKAIKNIVEYKNKEDKARVVGIHLEGPYFNLKNKGAQPEKYIKLPNIDELKEVVELSDGLLKMVSLAPELDGGLEAINYLTNQDIRVSMAHTNATYDEAMLGIENGATVATHLFNGMRVFNHREPGVVGASLLDERVYCEIICDRYHLHDAAMKIAFKTKGHDKIILVSDAMRAAGLDDGEYDLGGQQVVVKDGLTRLKSGSIAGSTLNLQTAVYNAVKYLNVPLKDAVKMASLNPAEAMGLNDLGSIEIGKRGDLILFDEDITISQVILGGKSIWKKN